MLKLTLRTLNANKIRLAMTTFAVVLGVSFVVSSFVLGDGLRSSFSSLAEEVVGGTDLEVRPGSDFGDSVPIDTSLVEEVSEVDGVRAAFGQVESENVQPVTADGTPVETVGPPLLGFSWIDDPSLSRFTVVDGRAPKAGLEFTIDQTSAGDHDFVIGNSYDFITPNGRVDDVQLVGLTRFGDNNDTLGAVLTQFPLDTAQDLFNQPSGLDRIAIDLEPGADLAAVQTQMTALLPSGVIAVDQTTLLADTQSDFTSGIDIFNNILLAFAGVALFVSMFIIANTFSIVLGQRTKELALLRAIGASGKQVRRSAMGEALIVGVVASAVGIAAGLGLNYGLRAMFDALGAELPASPLILATRTIIVAFAVGVGVTVVSAFGPARKASRVSPMEALRDSEIAPASSIRRRVMTGTGVLAIGAAVGGFALFGDMGTALRMALLAGGAAAVFLGMSLASPAAAKPIIGALGTPLRVLGIPGRLSTKNAGRNPRRTASTAASLMIGLALVTTALVVGESVKQSISETLATSVRADFIANPDESMAATVAEELAESDTFSAVTGFRYEEFQIDDSISGVMGADLEATDQLFDLEVSSGALENTPNAVAVFRDEAEANGLEVGSTIDVVFPTGIEDTLNVVAIFDASEIVEEDYVVPLNDWTDRFGQAEDWWAAALVAPGVSEVEASAALNELSQRYPQVEFQSQVDFKESIESQIDQMLVAINAMLVLAVIIALIGIANTLALSVFERTRELGLLRAVGMSRRQTRRMVRWEAVQVSLFGSVLGVSLGAFFGWAAVTALPDSFVSALAFPTTRIAILLAVCAVCGLLAAALPARRAGNLNVLDAISHA